MFLNIQIGQNPGKSVTKDSISVTHVLAALSAVSLCQYHLNESDFAAQAPGSGQKRDQRDICTCSRALGGTQRDPNGWMDRSSNAPGVSNTVQHCPTLCWQHCPTACLFCCVMLHCRMGQRFISGVLSGLTQRHTLVGHMVALGG